MIRATAATKSPAVANTDVWVSGSTIDGGAFTNANHEAIAVDIADMGFTVIRTAASTITTPPTTADCGVLIHCGDTVGGTTVLRATAANAAPVINLAYASNANANYQTALHSVYGDDASHAGWTCSSTTPTWTDGYAVNDNVTIFGWAAWYVELAGTATGGVEVWRSQNGDQPIIWIFPAGITNLASAVTTARCVTLGLDATAQHMNAAGMQIFKDLINWAMS